MDILIVSPSELSTLVKRIDTEIITHLRGAFPAPPKSIESLGQGVTYSVCNRTKRIDVQSVVIPFDYASMGQDEMRIAGATIEMVAYVRDDSHCPWTKNKDVFENGHQVIQTGTLDADAIEDAASDAGALIQSYFTTELAPC